MGQGHASCLGFLLCVIWQHYCKPETLTVSCNKASEFPIIKESKNGSQKVCAYTSSTQHKRTFRLISVTDSYIVTTDAVLQWFTTTHWLFVGSKRWYFKTRYSNIPFSSSSHVNISFSNGCLVYYHSSRSPCATSNQTLPFLRPSLAKAQRNFTKNVIRSYIHFIFNPSCRWQGCSHLIWL